MIKIILKKNIEQEENTLKINIVDNKIHVKDYKQDLMKEKLQQIYDTLERNNLRIDDVDKLIKINKINDYSYYITKIKAVLKKIENK